jgi:proteasome assembly chaperone (PAC2) family protein
MFEKAKMDILVRLLKTMGIDIDGTEIDAVVNEIKETKSQINDMHKMLIALCIQNKIAVKTPDGKIIVEICPTEIKL